MERKTRMPKKSIPEEKKEAKVSKKKKDTRPVGKSSVEKDPKTSPTVRKMLKAARVAHKLEREAAASDKSHNIPLADAISAHGGLVSEEAQDKLTEKDCIDLFRGLVESDPDRFFSRNFFRKASGLKERVWTGFFGSFQEFKAAAGITRTRQVRAMEKAVAKHRSVDHYRAINRLRKGWGKQYDRPNKNRHKVILAACDFHGQEADLFALRVFLDTAKRVQPDVVCLAGDIFDVAEFGRYDVDPREWSAVEEMNFVHGSLLGPLRKAVPDAQIDFIEGNHEARIARHFADSTPVMRAVLSDFHGMTLESLLGLDKHEINFVGQADLAAWTKRDHLRELRHNHKVYFDCVLAHHFPHGRNRGLWGFCGHHHKHEMWTRHTFNTHVGELQQVEFHQLGAMHVRNASYTEGDKWSNGFALVHVDTKLKNVAIEYVNITSFAVVGGKYFTRTDSEASPA